jgi:hypothetical protein
MHLVGHRGKVKILQERRKKEREKQKLPSTARPTPMVALEIVALSIEYLPVGERFPCHGSTSTVNHLSPPLPHHQGRPREIEQVGELEHRGSNAYSKGPCVEALYLLSTREASVCQGATEGEGTLKLI